MRKTLLSLITLTLLSFTSSAQIVTIPDANFKNYLVLNPSINTNADTEIQVTEAAAFSGDIFGNNLNITDLTGIEAFTSLTGLYVRDNNLGSIDVSANTALTYLDCQNTNISALNISTNTALTGVTCALNSLTSLDVSNNTALWAINCGGNNITSLDVSNTVLLSNFSCDNNDLDSLDVSNNTALLYFVCHFNNLTSLDVSNCAPLSWLSCSENNLSTLDLTNNTALGNLFCASNNITNLDLSANSSMIYLNCSSNNLSSLDVSNGNNVNFNTFNALTNPNLACIQVDDDVWSTANWTGVDPTSSFSLNCVVLVNSITVQGQGGVSTISTPAGTLQMEAIVLPANADDATYTWSVTNGTGSATISASGVLTAAANGIVTVTATANDASGISGTADITISNQDLGVNEQASIHSLSIYPNPARSQITIDINEEIKEIVIIDITGKTVETIVAPNNTIDVSHLTKGVYFLKVELDTILVSKKFIKD